MLRHGRVSLPAQQEVRNWTIISFQRWYDDETDAQGDLRSRTGERVDHLRNSTSIRPSEARVLDLLTTPMTATDIAHRLLISRQRVHQIVSRLLGRDLVRLSGSGGRGRLVARWDDPAVLLSHGESRVLSAFRLGEKVSVRSVAAATGLPDAAVASCLSALGALDLAEERAQGDVVFWSITEKGTGHPQFHAQAKKAPLVPVGIRSDRTENVLSLLLDEGPLRGIEISRRLSLERQSCNALLQYLKRKRWVRKIADDLFSAYELTEQGVANLEALARRRAAETGGQD